MFIIGLLATSDMDALVTNFSTVFLTIGAIIGVGITLPLLIQFVNGVSRNISLTNQNMTEEISKSAKQAT